MLILSKTLAMRRRMKMMLRKAELMMVLAAGSNVRIRTEDGGRFTSSRSLPYISHTATCTTYIVHTYIYTRLQCCTIHINTIRLHTYAVHTNTSTCAVLYV